MNKYLDKNPKHGNSGSHLVGQVFFGGHICSQQWFLLYFIAYQFDST